MIRFLLVCAGGAVGTGARYTLGAWITSKSDSAFPFGTLTINVLGSLAMGFLAQYAASRGMSETTRLALATGVLGGFTTYSAFNQETLRLLHSPSWGAGVAYLAATVALCLAAGVAGFAASRALGG
jgi:CrcB protein